MLSDAEPTLTRTIRRLRLRNACGASEASHIAIKPAEPICRLSLHTEDAIQEYDVASHRRGAMRAQLVPKLLAVRSSSMIDHENCCGATDVGRKRENNQDAFLVGRLSKSIVVGANSLEIEPQTRLFGDECGWLMLVADGMGGHAGGERASSLAIRYLVERLLNNVHWFFRLNPEAEQEFVGSLKKLLCDTHQEIQSEGRKDLSLAGMGTTLTMTYLVWPTLYVLHAGDSRCYLIRHGQVERLTTDHTLARRMVESGGMKPEEESASRWSNVLWNVLGGKSEEQLRAEVRQVNLQYGDTIVLCSDGLHRHLSDDKLIEVLESTESCKQACQALIAFANEQGGDDNITVIVAHTPQDPHFDPLATTDSGFTVTSEPSIFDTTGFEESVKEK